MIAGMVPDAPYKQGDKVCREKDIENPSLGLIHGRINRVYASTDRNDRRFRYPEMYEVLWSDGRNQSGYLRHGLSPIC